MIIIFVISQVVRRGTNPSLPSYGDDRRPQCERRPHGFGLFVTTIILTFQNWLDLYHAIVVLYIGYFLALVVYFSGALLPIPPDILHTDTIRRCIQMDAHKHISQDHLPDHHPRSILNWSIYVLTNVKTFGSTPQCDSKISYIVWIRGITSSLPLPIGS